MPGEEIIMYRSRSDKMHFASTSVTQQSGGYRAAAVTTHNGSNAHIFNNTEIGQGHLALIGTREQITGYLMARQHIKVINSLQSDRPRIYLKVETYEPGDKFKTISPGHTFVSTAAEKVTSFFSEGASQALDFPQSTAMSALQVITDASGLRSELSSRQGTPRAYTGKYCVKISHIKEDDSYDFIACNQTDLCAIGHEVNRLIPSP
ncbi:hypothetical protein MO867_19415 [Microbulbifer sp. OS29]|uniref:Uncharacterized protein n=1 Tax=Microbulbifer okhotskensis TaxID=2926617 RepID=A0A9X2ERK8_9GAMM|nr:hypothetical protein [Microbulbifer okhotskensis]MCO1336505.1 hypothetical protein [Microbulbifer okhotskensis]